MIVENPPPAATRSLWTVRAALAARSLRQNWSMFRGTRIGVVGLAIIVFYLLLAAAHPILMNTVWDEKVYDPVVG